MTNEFDHKSAQVYEMKSAAQWIDENFTKFMDEIDTHRRLNFVKPHYVHEFFENDQAVFDNFYKSVMYKKCLEVGAGPLGFIALLNHALHGDKYIIDPLALMASKYLLQKYGRTWFDLDLVLYDCPAEQKIDHLVNEIDGFIFARNCWDHTANAKLAIATVASYAVSGCLFLTWADTKQLGPTDAGHQQCIFDKPQDMEDYILSLGFNLVRRCPPIREPGKTEEYGGVFIKE